MANSGDTLNIRFNTALNLPLHYRCEELANIFEQYGNKELQLVLPHLLENLFGLTNQVGWGLRTLYRNFQPHEFEVLFRFLQPNGPMFRLCYKLLTECYMKYEFPLAHLPRKVRKMIEDGMIPPFYADKLQFDSHTRVPTSLVLNAFEFYIFHFAYHLVNPWLHRTIDQGFSSWETLYVLLSEEYLTHFLPCDGSQVPPYAGGYIHPKSTIPLQTTSRPARSPTLFRRSVILKQGSTSGNMPILPQQNSMVEIWRSELVIQVFIDFWLSYGDQDMPNISMGTPPRPYPSPQSMERSYNYVHGQVQNQSNMPLRHYPDLLPSTEHIRIVRNLVKHLHYFANSVVGDLSAMDELKRIILPSSQSKIYGFLRHTIHHWPLDSSFRLILETWLSYIQPWRYSNWRHRNMRSPPGRETEDRDRSVDQQWINFIAENLLSYTVIFRQLLPRFQRLDLVSLKNAYMLFRVAKVFSQPNLNRMLMEVERCLEDVSGQGLPNSSVSSRSHAETSHQGHKWNAVVRQQILELEGAGFQYKPMFGSETIAEVFQFMIHIQQAKTTAYNLALKLEMESREHPSGFFSSLMRMFSYNPCDTDEYTLEDRKKVVAYLEASLTQFSTIFDIERSRLPCMNYSGEYEIPAAPSMATSMSQQGETPGTSSQISPNQTPLSTVLGSRDWKERQKHIKYEGDPDLQPIKSTENAFLVRLLYQITSKLNEMYTLEMCHLYEHGGLMGCLARQVLCPPMVARTYDKSRPGFSPQVQIVLPPRLSLRSFASHQTIAYLFLGMAIAWTCGYDPTSYIFVLTVLWIFFILVKAVFESLFGSTQQRPHNLAYSPGRSDLSDNSF